jgi:hypothetical protein
LDISKATVVLPDPTGPVTRSVGTGTLSPEVRFRRRAHPTCARRSVHPENMLNEALR